LSSIAAVLGICGFAAARMTSLPTGADPARADPERAASGRGTMTVRFDGEPSGAHLGTGWFHPLAAPGADGRHGVAWSQKASVVYFARPTEPELDLVLVARAASTPQHLAVYLNDAPTGSCELDAGAWRTCRLELSPPLLRRGVNAVAFVFDQACVVPGTSAESVPRAALFDTIAIVPRNRPLGVRDLVAAGGTMPVPAEPGVGLPTSLVANGQRPPHIFLYVVDTLRADALGAYGGRHDDTPNIDDFSRDAVLFRTARSAASWTLPSTVSILSGVYPSRHGVVLPGNRVPAVGLPWLPERLHRAGYETFGVSQWLLGADFFDLHRGFDGFYTDVQQDSKTRSREARWFVWREILDRPSPEKPLFAYVHVVDPHAPYQPAMQDQQQAESHPGASPAAAYEDPRQFASLGLQHRTGEVAHLRALYDGEVRGTDREFGAFLALLRSLRMYDDSLIIFTSDHGEEFFEHGGFEHGRTLYEEALKVPLIIKLPRARLAGETVSTPVSTVDIAATIAELAGVSRAGFEGRSLTEPRNLDPLVIHAETQTFADGELPAVNMRALWDGRVKCIWARPAAVPQVYDLEADAGEHSPLDDGEWIRTCDRRLAAWAQRSDAIRAPSSPGPLSAEDAAKLRAMGYLH
jgi:arylsulfatase A-like enzyme